jgi:sec-independent protein translocase protein TatC
MGIVTPSWLAQKRKFALIAAFILGAAITPTIDPINQVLVAGPIIVLYELSIWLSKLARAKERVPIPPEVSQ